MKQLLIKYCFSERKTEILHITDMLEYYSTAISKLEAEGMIGDIITHELMNKMKNSATVILAMTSCSVMINVIT